MTARFLKFFSLYAALYLLVPLAGWLLGGARPLFSQFGADLAVFFQHPARLAFAVLVGAAAAARGVIAARIPLPPIQAGLHSEVLHLRNIMLEAILVLAPFSDRRELIAWAEVPALRWLGVGLFALGMGVYLVAVAEESAALRCMDAKSAPPLISGGPFRWVRYPLQAGMLVFALGLALLFRSWVSLVAWLFMINAAVLFIQGNEKVMAARHGAQWKAYSAKTQRLIPRVW